MFINHNNNNNKNTPIAATPQLWSCFDIDNNIIYGFEAWQSRGGSRGGGGGGGGRGGLGTSD